MANFFKLTAGLSVALAVPIDTGYSTFEITKYSDGIFEISAEVMEGTYLAIAYGTDMTNTDMVWFSANEAGAEVKDLFGVSPVLAPSVDSSQDYTNLEIDTNWTPGIYKFTTRRAYSTGDTHDYQVLCDNQDEIWTWAVNKDTPSFVEHNNLGQFYVKISKDCDITLSSTRLASLASLSALAAALLF
mmetsp:Transcript_32725/g.49979  ORF Transcript_32725/g.49979 Transcript_32725/m.49979 type:complete len:187 (-) Transcript_32725:105-665(-)